MISATVTSSGIGSGNTVNPATALHFCSTPRNVFLSLGQAHAQTGFTHHLLLIDQMPGERSAFINAVLSDPGPFATVHRLEKGRGAMGKHRARKRAHAALAALVPELAPQRVYTGNDRRMEFQYFMHRATELQIRPEGIYLEDGINSYVGVVRQRTRPVADSIVEPLLKRLFYGPWYDRSAAVGATRWIDRRLLTFPDACAQGSGPPVELLCAGDYREGPFIAHMERLSRQLIGEHLSFRGDLLLLPPHSNDLIASWGSVSAFREAVQPLIARHETVACKYHPLEPLNVLNGLAKPLPQTLPMEMLAASCDFPLIVGDTSAALLGVKWLNPGADIVSVARADTRHDPLFELMRGAGIRVVDNYALLHR